MFSLQFPKVSASRRVRPLAMLAIAALAAPGAALADSHWTSVGSTGTVDESCVFTVQLNNNEARLLPGMLMTCTIRYQVVDTYSPAPPSSRLAARILDNGAGARVDVRLRSYNILTGATSTVATINSDTGVPDPINFRTYQSTACFTPNFAAFSYWIEVDLVRLPSIPPTLPGNPAIALVNLRDC